MLRRFLLIGAAIAAPALAQTTAPASTNAAQPAAAATPSASAQQPTTAVTPSATATPAAQTAPAAPTNPTDAVKAVVSTDWAKYDADGNGALSKTEFGAWMTALRESNPAQKAAVKDPAAWTTAAFAQADKDKSGSVNKTELEGFLKG